ncbi:MAG: LysR family transcriptional regulator [Lachnospiraceae bacterium]|jgi:DNA-binding transcriptional LysR family regulator|nr:LysR family transcriptional regulator [Lachnospiraceae bacterium]
MDINYELYKVFYQVAAALSFSEASSKLYISQSAVSQAIKALEKKLGCSLFIRSTKKVQLTTEGELLLRHIEPAMRLIQKGELQLSDQSLGNGSLRIGASDTICRYFLVPYLERFHNEYPESHISVTNATSLRCVELLESGVVDLIVVNYPNSALGLVSDTIKLSSFQDHFIIGESFKGNSEIDKRIITFSELMKFPIMMLNRNSTTNEFLHSLLRTYQVELVPEIEVSSNDFLIDLVRIGLGIAFIPDYCLQKNREGIAVIKTLEKIPERELVAVTSGHSPLSKAAEIFLSYFA